MLTTHMCACVLNIGMAYVCVVAGTNLFDASETAAAVAEDAALLPAVRTATPGGAGLRQALRARGVQVPLKHLMKGLQLGKGGSTPM